MSSSPAPSPSDALCCAGWSDSDRTRSALAQAVAILEHATLRDAGELARLEPESAVAAADDLLAAGILTAEPLGFVHPLLRIAVYEQIPPAGRADDHRRAALMLATDGASTLALGSHLLRALPAADPQAVALLRKAAGEAFAGGDLNAAIALLRRALAEPPDALSRGRRARAARSDRGARSRLERRRAPDRGAWR